MLVEDCNPYNDDLVKLLAKAGCHISIRLSDVYATLEKICLEGTRAQSKLAISAIAALMGSSEQFLFTELCKTLVHSLFGGQNIPTVLQSLGCMAQHSVSTFENQAGEITQYIVDKIFQSDNVAISDDTDSSNGNLGCCVSCRWKIYGLKTLVKSYLPHQPTVVRRDIKQLLDILMQMLYNCDSSDGILSCESDNAIIRLMAAKSVLRLSRRWDLHVPPEIFHLTVLIAKDSPSPVRRLFIEKIHKFLKERIVPIKYACAFSLAASDSPKDLHDDSLKCIAEFIREYSKEVRILKGGVINSPVYIMVFLIHILAHDVGFPPENCEEEIYAQFVSPLIFTMQALVNANFVDGDLDLVSAAVSYARIIFHAIKRAEDSANTEITPKLHILADFGLSILNVSNLGAICKSHTPDLISLPSSFYKNSTGGEGEGANVNSLAWYHLNATIAKKVAPNFESQVVQPSNSLTKRDRRRFHDVCLASETVKCSMSNLLLCQNNHSMMNQIKENGVSSVPCENKMHETTMREYSTRSRKRRALPPIPCGSVVLHDEIPIIDEHPRVAPRNSEPSLGREQLVSSCDSVTTRSSRSPNEDLTNSASLILCDLTKSNKTDVALSEDTNTAALCTLKDAGNTRQELVGQRIKLWSPLDNCHFSAMVDGFDPQNNTHKITYDNGEVEVVSLDSENWDPIPNYSIREKVARRTRRNK